MVSLEGKTVLITGAASGIGRAIALGCADAGATLVIGDVAEGMLAQTTADLDKRGVQVRAARCDVKSADDVDALFQLARAELGEPDIVFANAGIEGRVDMAWGYAEAEVAEILNINFMGVWRTLKAAMPGMLSRGSGSFVATSSVAGVIGAEGVPIYVASKHAIVGLVRSSAISAAPSNVRVNAICPGMTRTPLLDRLMTAHPELGDALMAKTPMRRLGEPDEIARAAIWLGSDEASFITGHTLVADGAYSAQ